MLPIFHTKDKDLSLLQTQWSSQLNPLLSLPLLNGLILRNIALQSGDNVIDHRLGRPLVGWLVIRQRDAFYGVYDKQDDNPRPSLTLILNAAGNTNVDLYVF